ncbi:CotH kinase family protein [Methanimicrococcus sp. OttesenSCG-928-J09]|nr:CotH kinase family protein [Methanimicrococcus sp. OttesenSCG-928-J09]
MSSEKGTGAINSKYLNAATIILAAAAVVFVLVLMFAPGMIGIYSASQSVLYEEKIFNTSEITSISIEISDEDWADMLANPTAEEFHRCNVTINGETFYSVGIRTKGMTSLSQVASSDSDRYSFKLKADKYVSGQTFFGLEEFVINNMYQDPTYMKEYLSYDMMSYIGVPTPLIAFADIELNDEPWGLYLAVEAVEEDFAARVFGGDFGQLYKPESMNMGGGGMGGGGMGGGGQGGPNNAEGVRPGDAGGNFPGTFPSGIENGGVMPLQAAEGMSFDQESFNQANFDQAGEQQNIESGMQNADGFPDMNGGRFGGGGPGGFGGTGGGADLVYTDDNVSSYNQIFENAVFSNAKDSDFKRVITALKYLNAGEELETYVDVDETLRYFAANTVLVNLDSYVSNLKHNYYLYEKNGQISILPWDFNLAFGAFQGGDASSSVNFPIDTPVSGVSLEDRPLIGVLLENETYKETYHVYLSEIIDGYFNSGYYDETITRLDALINESVQNDATSFYNYSEYLTAVETLRLYGELRAESVQGQLNGTIPSTSEGQQSNPDALIDASELNMNEMGGMGNMGRADGNSRQRGQTGTDVQAAAAVPAVPSANANTDANAAALPSGS